MPQQHAGYNQSIRMKLISSFMLVFLAITAYGLFVSSETQTMHGRLVAAQARDEQYTMLWNLKYGNRQLAGKARAVIYTTGQRADALAAYATVRSSYAETDQQLVGLFDDQADLSRLETLRAIGDQLRSTEQQMFDLVAAGHQPLAAALLKSQYQDQSNEYLDEIDRFLQAQSTAIATGVLTLRQESLNIDLASFVALTLILVLILLVFLFISRNLIQPIQTLAEVAEAFSEGNFAARGVVRSHDEIGDLTNTFNAMGERLSARTRDLQLAKETLEDDVKRRTVELEEKVKELERFNKFVVGRELKMVELKKQLKALKKPGAHD